jgi:undecaprenyl-diphosphatase
MDWIDALLLGIIEGFTEFLPVSSTGHLYLVGAAFGHDDEASKGLDIVMQLGAVFAVVIFYRARLAALLRGLLARDPASLRLLVALACGFCPAAVVGLAFHERIERVLMAPLPVAGALVVGGVIMVVVELVRRRGTTVDPGEEGLDKVTPRRALVIGCAQCMSVLWPGFSRSMSTIVGGQLTGLNTATSAEFSFFLFIPTLGAATLFGLYKHGREIVRAPGGAAALGVSLLAAFVVSLAAIVVFLQYLKRRGLAPFGVYRVVAGVLAALYFWSHPLAPKAHGEPAPTAVTMGDTRVAP